MGGGPLRDWMTCVWWGVLGRASGCSFVCWMHFDLRWDYQEATPTVRDKAESCVNFFVSVAITPCWTSILKTRTMRGSQEVFDEHARKNVLNQRHGCLIKIMCAHPRRWNSSSGNVGDCFALSRPFLARRCPVGCCNNNINLQWLSLLEFWLITLPS